MNDDIMCTWEVIMDDFWSNQVNIIHVCARQETAEYLRDWCEAINENILRTFSRSEDDYRIRAVSNGIKYEIQEGEVIL